jgi:hypothetical protein
MGKENLGINIDPRIQKQIRNLNNYTTEQLEAARNILYDVRANLKRDPDTDLPRDGQAELRKLLDLQIFEITKRLSG